MSELDEETCAWCNGTGGNWQFVITMKNNEIGTAKCRACYGLGKILRRRSVVSMILFEIARFLVRDLKPASLILVCPLDYAAHVILYIEFVALRIP